MRLSCAPRRVERQVDKQRDASGVSENLGYAALRSLPSRSLLCRGNQAQGRLLQFERRERKHRWPLNGIRRGWREWRRKWIFTVHRMTLIHFRVQNAASMVSVQHW